MIPDEELQDLLATAVSLTQEAAELLKKMQGSQHLVEQKDKGDFSTSADIAAETLIIKGIQAKYPSHSILSEEKGRSDDSSDYLWIIDPLDGTKEYARGSSDFNVLIALEYKRELIVGAYYRNINNVLYKATSHQGSFRNDKCLEVSKKTDLSTSMVGFRLPRGSNGPQVVHERVTMLEKMINICYRVRCPSDDAHSLGMVAEGLLDAHILYEGVCHWYDIAPSLLLVKEAGGMVTDFNGDPVKSEDFSKGIVASNGLIHKSLLEILTS